MRNSVSHLTYSRTTKKKTIKHVSLAFKIPFVGHPILDVVTLKYVWDITKEGIPTW